MERNKEAKEYFSKEAQTYYEKHYGNPNDPKVYPNLYLRHRYILDLLKKHIVKGKTKVLDIGCGSGIMAKDLLDMGCKVWAFDISQDMIDASKKTIGENKNVTYGISDIEKIKQPDSFFDIVVVSGVIEYLKTDDKALKEINRVLKPGGVAVISIQNKIALPRIFVELADMILPKTIKKKVFTLEQHKRHNPLKLDSSVKRFGFKKIGHAYFHFYPFFIPFDRLFPRIYVYLGKKMERFRKTNLGVFLATGYVIKVKKTG